MAKRKQSRARRTYRRVAGFVRRHKWSIPSLGALVWLGAYGRRMVTPAVITAVNKGDYVGAGSAFLGNHTLNNAMPLMAGGVALAVTRSLVGPVNVARVGKWQVRAL